MNLEKKKVQFVGDSITDGVGVSCREKTYWGLLTQKYHLDTAVCGISGMRIARQQHPVQSAEFEAGFCGQLPKLREEADLIVVFAGTNDFGHGDAPFGSFEDRTEDSFYGACHVLFRGLNERFPAATVVIMTPVHRNGEKIEGKNPLSAYVDAIREVAAYYAFPVLDLYRTAGFNPQIPLMKELYVPDGLHPNDAGHVRIMERLEAFLSGV